MRGNATSSSRSYPVAPSRARPSPDGDRLPFTRNGSRSTYPPRTARPADADCLTGRRREDNVAGLTAPLPPDVPALPVFLRPPRRHRGPWQSSLDPSPTHAEVRGTHVDLPVDPDVYSAIEPVLTTWAGEHDPGGRAQQDHGLRRHHPHHAGATRGSPADDDRPHVNIFSVTATRDKPQKCA
ncbi:hypothetical protein GCM10017567_74410 [Amycolatopsis bullii]|uniref:Uncharacterized protein n=1 Tax=Amycolatopsis bullii TaxID=941987 RepID=A0ABQ3KPD5_9PSEU|nr:hypothetical protein GCM10017567_74410 [Amycolatopsis bullii]